RQPLRLPARTPTNSQSRRWPCGRTIAGLSPGAGDWSWPSRCLFFHIDRLGDPSSSLLGILNGHAHARLQIGQFCRPVGYPNARAVRDLKGHRSLIVLDGYLFLGDLNPGELALHLRRRRFAFEAVDVLMELVLVYGDIDLGLVVGAIDHRYFDPVKI